MVSRRRISRARLPIDQDFRRAGPGIVIGAQGHAVGAGVQDRHQVSFFYLRQFPIPGKEVARLTHRADDIDHRWLRLRILDHGQNLMVGLVERRPDEVVHPGVCDYESFASIALDHQHPGQQGSGLGNQEPAGLEQ